MLSGYTALGVGTGLDKLQGVAVDGAGDVVAVGQLMSYGATFGHVELSRISRGSSVIVWKLNAQGSTLWAIRGGGTDGLDQMHAVAIDASGGIFAAGEIGTAHDRSFAQTATFGGVVLTVAGKGDGVVWKISPQGTTIWAERGGGGRNDDHQYGSDNFLGVASDGAGNVVLSGLMKNTPSPLRSDRTPTPSTFGDVVLSYTDPNARPGVMWKIFDNTLVDPPPSPPLPPPSPPSPPPIYLPPAPALQFAPAFTCPFEALKCAAASKPACPCYARECGSGRSVYFTPHVFGYLYHSHTRVFGCLYHSHTHAYLIVCTIHAQHVFGCLYHSHTHVFGCLYHSHHN